MGYCLIPGSGLPTTPNSLNVRSRAAYQFFWLRGIRELPRFLESIFTLNSPYNWITQDQTRVRLRNIHIDRRKFYVLSKIPCAVSQDLSRCVNLDSRPSRSERSFKKNFEWLRGRNHVQKRVCGWNQKRRKNVIWFIKDLDWCGRKILDSWARRGNLRR